MLLSSLEIISSLALGISDDRSRFRCLTMPRHIRAHAAAHHPLFWEKKKKKKETERKMGNTRRWIFHVVRFLLTSAVAKRRFEFIILPLSFLFCSSSFFFFFLSVSLSLLSCFVFCADFLLAGIFIVLRIWCSFVVTSRSQQYFIRDEWAETA